MKELFTLEQEAGATDEHERVRIMELESEQDEQQIPGDLIGEICNRNGRDGLLQSGTTDSCCACHISAPCRHCVTVSCTKCDYTERP